MAAIGFDVNFGFFELNKFGVEGDVRGRCRRFGVGEDLDGRMGRSTVDAILLEKECRVEVLLPGIVDFAMSGFDLIAYNARHFPCLVEVDCFAWIDG